MKFICVGIIFILLNGTYSVSSCPPHPDSRNIGSYTLLVPQNTDTNILPGFSILLGSGTSQQVCVYFVKNGNYTRLSCTSDILNVDGNDDDGDDDDDDNHKYKFITRNQQYVFRIGNISDFDNGMYQFVLNSGDIVASSKVNVLDVSTGILHAYGRVGRRMSIHFELKLNNSMDVVLSQRTPRPVRELFSLINDNGEIKPDDVFGCLVEWNGIVEPSLHEGVLSIYFNKVSHSTTGRYMLGESTRRAHKNTIIEILIHEDMDMVTFISKKPGISQNDDPANLDNQATLPVTSIDENTTSDSEVEKVQNKTAIHYEQDHQVTSTVFCPLAIVLLVFIICLLVYLHGVRPLFEWRNRFWKHKKHPSDDYTFLWSAEDDAITITKSRTL